MQALCSSSKPNPYIGDEDSAFFDVIHTVDSNRKRLFVSITVTQIQVLYLSVFPVSNMWSPSEKMIKKESNILVVLKVVRLR